MHFNAYFLSHIFWLKNGISHLHKVAAGPRSREITGNIFKFLIKNDFYFFLMCYIKWFMYILYYAFRNSLLICAKRARSLSAGVWSSLRLLSTVLIGAGDFFPVDCDSDFNNCPFRMISVYQEKFHFRILNKKYFKTLKTHCINCYSLETIFFNERESFSSMKTVTLLHKIKTKCW